MNEHRDNTDINDRNSDDIVNNIKAFASIVNSENNAAQTADTGVEKQIKTSAEADAANESGDAADKPVCVGEQDAAIKADVCENKQAADTTASDEKQDASLPNTEEDEDDMEDGDPAHGKKNTNALNDIFDWVEIFAISVAVVLFLFTFVFRLAVVDGNSMNQTLQNGETLIVRRLLYEPQNGDIVIFQTPYNDYSEPLVKRVIACGGQTVDIDFKNWQVYVDGEPVEEEYVNYILDKEMRNTYDGDKQEYPLYVPKGMLFVMGDNRNDSLDSRSLRIGLIDEDLVMGKVIYRLFPLSAFGDVYDK